MLQSQQTPAIKFEFLNWVATPALARDQTQSHRLHEPNFRTNSTDPITGNDIQDIDNHPSLTDGDLTLYFESESSRRAYQKIPLNHPNLHLPYPASYDDDRGG